MATFFTHWIGFEAIKRYIDNLKEKGATETGVFDSQMETVLQKVIQFEHKQWWKDIFDTLTHLFNRFSSCLCFSYPLQCEVCVRSTPR